MANNEYMRYMCQQKLKGLLIGAWDGKKSRSSWDPVYSIPKGHQVFFIVHSKFVLFMFRKGFLKIFFLQVYLLLVLTSRTSFGLYVFQIVHKHKKFRQPLLYQLFTKAVHISTLLDPNQMNLGFVITNDKASYVLEKTAFVCLALPKKRH